MRCDTVSRREKIKIGVRERVKSPLPLSFPLKGEGDRSAFSNRRNDADGIKFLAVDPNRDLANHAFNLRSVMNMQQRK